jgi:hypothetical protein
VRKRISFGVAFACVSLIVLLAGAVTSPPAAAAANDPGGRGHCRPNPSAAIAVGGVWNGGGKCYDARGGVSISVPVTVENATFYDPQSHPPHRGSVQPIIRVKDTSAVRLSSLALVGTNTSGTYHAKMVGEAGIDILSSDQVTITNVTTTDTFGDGLTLGFQPHFSPSWNLMVNGLTVIHAGRQGITMAYVNVASMSNVNLISSAEAGWDFESDVPGAGSGNVFIYSATGKGVRIIESLSGPVAFVDSLISGNVTLINDAAASGQSVTFDGGTILLDGAFHGIPPAESGSGDQAISPSKM